ncbi:diguanylate cyclase [Chrysiogenes arsenatis]|uniref:diguanylate cyclase n=1 Tax=Chrysiogenes arsenatis TaxID=309797 RepID=UPI000411869C|nr:diguanylate cyclase [Chrysiogenes arsenatis]
MPLRHKIILLGFMALSGTLFALWLQYSDYRAQARPVEHVARNIQIITLLSNAVHEIQKERGKSALVKGSRTLSTYKAQINASDVALRAISQEYGNSTTVRQSLGQIRTKVLDNSELLVVYGEYSLLLQQLIDEMDTLGSEPSTAIAKTDMYAHIHLISAKEYLGQIRALLGYFLERQITDVSVMNNLIRLKSLHDEEMRKFLLKSTPELASFFHASTAESDLNIIADIILQLTQSGQFPTNLTVETWWQQASRAIDQLKALEDKSLVTIRVLIKQELESFRSSMRWRTITILGAGTLALLLAVSATITLLRAISRATRTIESITNNCNFQQRIPLKHFPDEIKRISASFNQLLETVQKLLKEKDILASTDPLTGLNNRLYFTKVLHEEAERKRRSGKPMALIMIDADHFKAINDTHGHNIGDTVLKNLATLIQSTVRSTDFIARWGGEEFVLLLRDDNCDAACIAAEKLRVKIENTNFPEVGTVTCSFGVTAWKVDDSEASFVARADDALYASKNAGRNCISCVSAEGEAITCIHCQQQTKHYNSSGERARK